MSDIRIEFPNGSYNNEDAYNRVIGYISNKEYIGGYGFHCDESLPIIEQFRLSEIYSSYDNPQKIWHFWITFSSSLDHTYLLNMAVGIAGIFSQEFQVIFGLDTQDKNKKRCRPHLHFGINAFSYYPDIPPLTKDKMMVYIEEISDLLRRNYSKNITLQFQNKKEY